MTHTYQTTTHPLIDPKSSRGFSATIQLPTLTEANVSKVNMLQIQQEKVHMKLNR